ncbi:MAG: 5-dehydro-4-deoxy-D-glucuronate isomerase, partial [Lutimonas sp.]
MSTTYETRYASSPEAVKEYDTDQLRKEFLIDNLMKSDRVIWTYSHYDRYMAGSAVPLKPL